MRHQWRTLKNSNINNSRCFNNIDYSKPRLCATGGARRPLVKKGTFSDDVLHRWRTLLVTKIVRVELLLAALRVRHLPELLIALY
ncbi:hypothetical protein J6590_006532 [Homalodisca vitripennis]|nr:hypothetical protein J6590_006532 [Homalodisca vitripennis]